MGTIYNAVQIHRPIRASASTGTVTNSDENLELDINTTFKGALFLINRTAETGTCTLDAKVQFYAPVANTWQDLEGAAFAQFADAATGDRYLMIYPGLTGSDADTQLSLDTSEGRICGQYMPRQCRLVVTTGGTSVANTYSAEMWWLP